ncbi:MAG: hypothetical protein QM737_08840 [Ferruginibacter sp.]
MKYVRGFYFHFFIFSLIASIQSFAAPAETNPPVITYTTISSPSCTTNGMILYSVTITDVTGIPLTGANRPRIYYKKNAGSWFSRPGTNTGGTSTNSTWNFAIAESDMGGVASGDNVYYYIIAQDLTAIPNIASNPAAGLVASNVNSVLSAPATPTTYSLAYNLSGTYKVGVGGNFPTLTAAIKAYNTACTISGPVIFELINNNYSTSETFPITINNRPDVDAIHTLTVRPSALASPVISGSSATQIIDLNGAKHIVFDGRRAGIGTLKSLSILNNNASGTTIRFINDAQNNKFKYCIIKGRKTGNFSGTIFFGTASASGTGNDNNTIDNNDITDMPGGQSGNCIFSSGTSGKENSNNSITNNNISNNANRIAGGESYGIFIYSGNNLWTVKGNRLFQTSTRLIATSPNHTGGIYISNGFGYTISNNIIGFANASGTGTTNLVGNNTALTGFPSLYSPAGATQSLTYYGIYMNIAASGATSNIDGNIIGGIAVYTGSNFYGISVQGGFINIGVNAGNTIGAVSGKNSIYVTGSTGRSVYGIYANCSGTSFIQNNTIGGITNSGITNNSTATFTGIRTQGTGSYSISKNVIGNVDQDNIRNGYFLTGSMLSITGSPVVSTQNGYLYGIISNSNGNSLEINNNTLRGWLSTYQTNTISGIFTSGAMTGSSPSTSVNNNFLGTTTTNWINSITDNNTNSSIDGIYLNNTLATTSNIKNNDIRGVFFGLKNCPKTNFITLKGATAANNIATISENTFTGLSARFSSAGSFAFISSNYAISSTGKLIIDNNKIVNDLETSGLSQTSTMISCQMTSSAGSQASITNNDFSNITASAGTNNFLGLAVSFGTNPCQLTVADNKLKNWTCSDGYMEGINISNVAGGVACTGNIISNLSCHADRLRGITVTPAGSNGAFNITGNSITALSNSGLSGSVNGSVNGIMANVSSAGTTQTTISNNLINGLTSSTAGGVVAGIYLNNGVTSSTVSVGKNKIYNLSATATGSNVYGINNDNLLKGIITYSNNYIGDLRAPLSNLAGAAIAGIKLNMVSGQANVYYNTIYLNATGTASVFSTAAAYIDPATQVTLRNNIFTNVSTHGTTGRTVAYWRGDSNLDTYNAASNNNLFYAGAASSQNLIFYDGTNGDQTIDQYKARVSSADNFSIATMPAFESTDGSDANFLHLATTGNCGIAYGGNNSGILLPTDYDGNSRSTISPFITDIGANEFTKFNTWTGASNDKWSDVSNWTIASIPNDPGVNVFIPSAAIRQPNIILDEIFQVNNLVIQSGASLTNAGMLKIAGLVYANASGFNNIQSGTVNGSVEMNGDCFNAQSVPGNIFAGNNVKDFKVSHDVNISPLANEGLKINGILSFGATGKILNTGDNLVLVSTKAGTASVADVTGNVIRGSATVERYINTGLMSNGGHLKSWQLLSTPTQGQSIRLSWQENGLTPPGYGTIVTGTGSGFDIATTNPSMKFYNPDLGTYGDWVGITNTSGALNDRRGYMLFVRGDRTVTSSGTLPNPTNMRSKGTLYQPSDPPPVTNVTPGKFASVGNPYASAIDLVYMKNNGLFFNLDNNVWAWDPLLYGSYGLGGYQTLAAANNYEPTAGGWGGTSTVYYEAGVPHPRIESGQAFFVKAKPGTAAGSVTFTESCKVSGSNLVNRFSDQDNRLYFRASLFTNTGLIADGNAVAMESVFSNTVDGDDAVKFLNAGENFMIIRNGVKLSVEARKTPVAGDTIFYSLSNLRKQPYRLVFAPKNIQSIYLDAFLHDKYLNTIKQLSLVDSNFIDININNDSSSYAEDRFYVTFQLGRTHEETNTTTETSRNRPQVENIVTAKQKEKAIRVYPNPVENKILNISFLNQLMGNCVIQLTNASGQLVYNSNIEIDNIDVTRAIKLDSEIATGNYILAIITSDGQTTRQQIIIR